MRKRVVGFFAALLLCLGALPGVALAEDYNLWVNGVQVTTENASDVLGEADGEDATVAYDAASNTLTLNGAKLASAYGDGSPGVVYYTGQGELTVMVENNNMIENENAVGIWSNSGGNIILTGTGSLTVKTGESVIAGAKITFDSGTYDFTSSGGNSVYAYSNDITITGTANVTARGESSYSTVYGENAVIISASAHVTAYADGADTINAGEMINIIGNAVVETTSGSACGIYTPGTLTVSGDVQVTAIGSLQGIQAQGGIDITGGTVIATSEKDAAIYARGCDMHIGGDAVVTCNTQSTGFAVVVGSSSTKENSLTIDDQAKLIATDIKGDGIFTGKDFNVGDNASVETTSTYSYGAVTFSENASVTANAGTLQSNAICAVGKLTISGSGVTVIATSGAEPNSDGGTFPAIMGFAGIDLSGGAQVDAKGTHSSAIQAANQSELTISGSGTVVTAITEDSDQAGIFGTGAVSVTQGAEVASSGNGMGMYSQDSIGIDNAKVDASGDNGGIVALSDVSIEDAEVTAASGSTSTAAIRSNGNTTIKGSNVQVTAAGSGIYAIGTSTVEESVIKTELVDPAGYYSLYGNAKTEVSSSWLDLSGNDGITPTDSVMFEGNIGTVYGEAFVSSDVEIPEGKTLNVPTSASLTVLEGTTLTNNGTVNVESQGIVTNSGTIVGDIDNAGTVTNEGIIQGSVTGVGNTTNNGGITQGGDSLQETSMEALQKMIAASVGKDEAVSITLTENIDGSLTIPMGANVVIDGGNQYKINGAITCVTSTDAVGVTNLTLKNLTLDGSQLTSGYGIYSANQSSTTVSGLNLTMYNCTVQNFNKKGVYLTNAVALDIDQCTFQGNATEDINDPNTYGDYTIDLNLMNVAAGDLSITNSTFSGTCGDKAVIKVSARGGASDTWQGQDIPGNTQTSVVSLTISGCTFEDTPAAAADVNIGTDSKADKDSTDDNFENNSTGDFAVTISNNKTDVSVFEANKTYKKGDSYYLASGNGTTEAENLTVPAGRTASKGTDGELVVQPLPTPGPTTYSVTVADTENGKVSVSATTSSAGERVTVTATPAEGYEVASVSVTCGDEKVDFTDNGDGTYAFEMPAGDVTVTVAFETPVVELPFTDVAEGSWYRGAVAFVYARGLMTGYEGTTLFGPEDDLGREQAAMVLYRALGAGAEAPECGLADVSQADWYAQAVNWAVASGLITGYDDGSGLFGVGDALTRDQFAAIIARVAKADLSEADPSALDAFSDGGEVAGWAVPAVSWAAQAGILEGSDDGEGGMELRASAEITRGEMATMIQRAAEAGLLPTA